MNSPPFGRGTRLRQIYVVFRAQRGVATLAESIKQAFPADHLEVGPGEWIIVADAGTAKDVSERIGITRGGACNGIVVAVVGYFGVAPSNYWEWLASRTKQADD